MTPCQLAAECYAKLTARSTSPTERTPSEVQSPIVRHFYARKFSADASSRIGKVFKTPFPELAEIAAQNDIKLDFALNSSDEAEEDEI